MELLTDDGPPAAAPGGRVVTIGVYDGVHLGHRALIDQARGLAEARGAHTAVVTFDRHPAMVVRPDSAPKLLTDLEQKLELLESTGVDTTLVVHFDIEQSRQPAEEFVQQILVERLSACAVVVGHDFHFGHERSGNVASLARMGGELGFDVLGIRLVDDDDEHEVVSSTRIRDLLTSGDVEAASRLLGRPHEVRGAVETGDARGRELGFPTANVAVPDDIQLPGDGIYAGWYERPDGSVHPAALSLGRRPTFYADGHLVLLEAYLLDFEGDLYGEGAKVRFVRRLRDEERFDSVDDLVAQMGRDVDAARTILTNS
ncbi:MAG TPA: bifunctional riboflavin kinase/FAD synthetase, partial [Acidimicrobiales bacterium]|nr:bifunctional riboflavin kinase/FAD synthetase [Acidimicrobiales bacterium]